MITKTDILAKVEKFREVNKQAKNSIKLTYKQKSELYGQIADDYLYRKIKSGWRPGEFTDVRFDDEFSRVPMIWSCEMHKVKSSWIDSIGYNEKDKVVKIITKSNDTTYAYAYQGVDLFEWQKFYRSRDKGSHFNKYIRKKFTCLRLI